VELERSQAAGAPFPVAAPRSDNPDRELYCAHYDDCLDVAVKLDWEGFSCSDCPIRGACAASKEDALEAATWGGTSVAAQLAESRTQEQAKRMRRTRVRRLAIGGRDL